MFNPDKTYAENLNIPISIYKSVPIDGLGLSVRLYNCLMRGGLSTLGEIISKTPTEISSIKNMGKLSLTELEAFLSSLSSKVDLTLNIKNKNFVNSESCLKISTLPIIRNNIDFIVINNFSFIQGMELNVIETEAIEAYREAVYNLGEELALDCVVSSSRIMVLYEMFSDFQSRTKKYDKIIALLNALPPERRNCKPEAFIRTYKSDETLRNRLRSFYPDENANLSMFSENIVFETPSNYQLFRSFLTWCNFDIRKDIEELMSKIFTQNRSRDIVSLRARKNTLEEIGKKYALTRERIRQIEVKACVAMKTYNAKYKIIMKISADNNGSPVITYEELERYAGEDSLVLYYLLSKNISSNYIYDNELDVFIVGDDSLQERTQTYLDTLPEIININRFDSIMNTGCEEEDIPLDMLVKAFHDTFKLTGDVYHRSRLKMRNIYSVILEKYYPDGCRIYDTSELKGFRDHIIENFGDVGLPGKDRAISARIADVGILCGKGKYRPKKKKYISKELANKIYDYITSSNNVIFLMNTLFYIFEDDLRAQGVDNKYYLQGILHEIFSDKFFFTRDYLSKDPNITSVYKPIINFVKNSKFPVSKHELMQAFPGVSEAVISFALDNPSILSLFGQYMHSSNIVLSDEETSYIRKVLDLVVQDGNTHNCYEIYEIINRDRPDILKRNYILFPFSMYSLLNCLFSDQYQFSRPSVAAMGVDMESPYNYIKTMPYESDTYPISKLQNFISKNRMHIRSFLELLNTYNDEYFIQDSHTLIRYETLGIDESVCRVIENIILEEINSTMPIFELNCWSKFPQISVSWTDWLIYSCINKWGTRLEVSISSNTFYNSVPIIGIIHELDKNKFGNLTTIKQNDYKIDDLDNIDEILGEMLDESDFWGDET